MGEAADIAGGAAADIDVGDAADTGGAAAAADTVGEVVVADIVAG